MRWATAKFDKARNYGVHKMYVDRAYRYWRGRILYALILGYASFYIVRQNLNIAAPEMLQEFGRTKSELGVLFSCNMLVYGLGKFVSGALCDRSNARYFMTFGLLGAALCTLCIGISHSLLVLEILYVASAMFQAMGWPPVSRLMRYWYSPKELGTRWGLVNASHQLGGMTILVGGGWLLETLGWRSVFIIPALVALVLAGILFERLRDTPESLGLPSIEVKEGLIRETWHTTGERITFREILLEHILPNRMLWCACAANFCVYIVRMGFLVWAPTFLREAKGATVIVSGLQSAGFELAGAFGGMVAGWISDKIFDGRRNAAAFYFMAGLIVLLFLFRMVPTNSSMLNSMFLFLIGFFVCGPQVLVGISGAESVSKRAAAAANGLTGTFGYLGGAFASYEIGRIAENQGWDAVFLFFAVSAVIGSFFFILNWRQTSQTAALERQSAAS